MKKVLAIILCIALIAAIGFTACGGDASSETSSEASSEESSGEEAGHIIHYVSNTLGDKSFLDSAQSGCVQLEEDYGVTLEYFEAKNDTAKAIPTLKDFIATYDDIEMIFIGGSSLEEPTAEVAGEYPDTNWTFYDQDVHGKVGYVVENLYCVAYGQNEMSYAVGYLGSTITNTGVIAFVGGGEIDVIKDFAWGFVEGSIEANPDTKCSISYIGNWDDIDRAKSLTKEAIALGSDYNYQVAGGAGYGLFEACLEAGEDVWAVGVDADQYTAFIDEQPEIASTILTSGEKRVGNSLVYTFKRFREGTLEFGTFEVLGLASGAVGVSESGPYLDLPQDVKDSLQAVIADISEGKIEVGTAYGKDSEEQDAFIKSLLP